MEQYESCCRVIVGKFAVLLEAVPESDPEKTVAWIAKYCCPYMRSHVEGMRDWHRAIARCRPVLIKAAGLGVRIVIGEQLAIVLKNPEGHHAQTTQAVASQGTDKKPARASRPRAKPVPTTSAGA